MLHAYHRMVGANVQYAILSHSSLVDIGYVTLKDITKFLAHKYIPDQEINAGKGEMI
jgi:hypothetical protein